MSGGTLSGLPEATRKHIEQQFELGDEMLRKITAQMIEEYRLGLNESGRPMAMM